ncbi:MAG: TIR domain-containing protein, partial [gamma proteobacterium symbiont of Ctena orbiculata]
RELVFISYSHKDKKWLSDLLTFLKPYQRKGLEIWADTNIEVGSRWERDIDHALSRACVGVLLVSQEFLASDFIYENELSPLLNAAESGVLTLVCVPVSSFTFDISDLIEYQWVRDPQQPLAMTMGNNRRRALVEVTNAIVEAVEKYARPFVEPAMTVNSRSAPLQRQKVIDSSPGKLHGVPQQRPNYIPRDDDLVRIKALILDNGHQAVGITSKREVGTTRIGVQGRGGIGKTVLAIDLANDIEVRRAFPHGVFWVTLGQQPTLELIQAHLLERITGETSTVENPQQGRARLADALTDSTTLLVLDDVWQITHVRALDVIGPMGRLVLTTRDSSLVTAVGAEELALDVLEPEVALDLLARWSGVDGEELPAEAAELAEVCGRLPLTLTLAGAQVRDGRAWRDLLGALEAGRVDYLDHPYGSVFSNMQLSLDAVTETDRTRLLELAVFPEDLPIPVTTIQRFWSFTGSLTDFESRALVNDLRNKGLLYLCGKDASLAVELHDLQRDFLLLLAEGPDLLHQSLLDAHVAAYQEEGVEWFWWQLPEDEPYLWDWLGLHLREVGHDEAFRSLLFDYRWLKAKLEMRGLNNLLIDFEGWSPSDAVGLVKSALELSAHVLEKVPAQLASQLLGRLLDRGMPEVQSLCKSVQSEADGVWLVPQYPSLTLA